MTPFNSTTDAFQLHPGLASEFMRDPVKVRIGAEGLKASHSITQIVEVVEPNDKDSHLTRLLKKYCGGQTPTPRTLIFALYKKECARVAENLRRVLCLYFKLVPIRPRSRGERDSLRTLLPGASLRSSPLGFNPRLRRLSTPPLTPFNSTPTSSLVRNDPHQTPKLGVRPDSRRHDATRSRGVRRRV